MWTPTRIAFYLTSLFAGAGTLLAMAVPLTYRRRLVAAEGLGRSLAPMIRWRGYEAR